MSKESLAKQEQGEPVAIVEKVIKNLEPLLSSKNQSWSEAEKMLLSILENQSEQPKQEQGEQISKERIKELEDAEYCLLAILERAGDGATVGNVIGILESLAKQEQGEPVAWCRYEDGMWVYYETKAWDDLQPLYTHPPQRTWVGLTDEEVKHEWEVWRANIPRYAGFATGIEAKLKQKNGFAEEKNT